MSKVTETILTVAKKKAMTIKIGDKVITNNSKKDVKVIKSIDVTDIATYIEIEDSEENSLTYGTKIFLSNFTLLDKEK